MVTNHKNSFVKKITSEGRLGKRITVLLFLLLGLITVYLIFMLSGLLSSIAQDLIPPNHFSANKNFRLAFIYENSNGPFWQIVTQGATNAGKRQNVHISFFESVHGQEFQLADYLRLAMLAKYDGIIIHAEDERITPLIQEAWLNKIPTIVVASDLPDSGRIGYVGTNNYRAGYVVGKTLMRKMANHKSRRFAVVSPLLGADMQMSVADSMKVFGFREAISSKGTNIPLWEKTEPTLLESMKAIRILLERHPNLDGIYTTYAEGTVAAARVVLEKGLTNRIHIIGHGDFPEIRKYITMGVIDASVVEYPYQIGFTAVKEMLGYLKENKVNISNNIDVIMLNQNNLHNFRQTEEPQNGNQH
jgi:ribose transport system substrate-binding protein